MVTAKTKMSLHDYLIHYASLNLSDGQAYALKQGIERYEKECEEATDTLSLVAKMNRLLDENSKTIEEIRKIVEERW